MSSTHTQSWGANKAVDGDRRALYSSGTCAISDNKKHVAWWYVDVGKELPIHHISIFYRTDNVPGQPSANWDMTHRGRFAGFYLYIGNDTDREHMHLCYHDIQNGTNSPNITIECVDRGRYVMFYNVRDPGEHYPEYYSSSAFVEICELEVYGCPESGQYGEECENCPPNCQDRFCNMSNGKCFSCQPGFMGDYCNNSCSQNTYGQKCLKQCGSCRYGKMCDMVTGSCPNGCAEGWYGEKCIDACPSGYYGFYCMNTCSENCVKPDDCDRSTGTCTGGCLSGYKGDRCHTVDGPGFSSETVYVLIALLSVALLVNVICITTFITRKFFCKKDITMRRTHPNPKLNIYSVFQNDSFTEVEAGHGC
ncbi:multiple epidermal growth factor-like domains protein 10 [Saccostrea echinata]|uniref:multiple epidermal growth factor-like domains protein 10 n=1 Tax=Saccostrea echinata TaxID=191078 RepID=UPI002A83C541|nr:multiple epidermal growth factor-like domains protein 10 [Saccostrea echinata]